MTSVRDPPRGSLALRAGPPVDVRPGGGRPAGPCAPESIRPVPVHLLEGAPAETPGPARRAKCRLVEPELACDECGDVSDLAAALSPADGQLHVVFGRFAANGARDLFYTRRKATRAQENLPAPDLQLIPPYACRAPHHRWIAVPGAPIFNLQFHPAAGAGGSIFNRPSIFHLPSSVFHRVRLFPAFASVFLTCGTIPVSRPLAPDPSPFANAAA